MMRYSEFAEEVLLSSLLEYLLSKEDSKLPFLNNANMKGAGSVLKRLLHDLENEMSLVQTEKERLMRVSGPNFEHVLMSDGEYLNRILVKHHYKSTHSKPHRKVVAQSKAAVDNQLQDRLERVQKG